MTETTVSFTEADLLRILREAAGVDEQVDLDNRDVSDIPLKELGYDSLAVLEFAARAERAYDIGIPDSDLEIEMTPRQIVAYINGRLTESGA
jgi:minimal PKS acyl carrier protein